MADGNKRVDIICVPTEAGTHFAGQCKAPEAILKTGRLEDKLQQLGFETTIHDQVLGQDVQSHTALWRPSPKINGVRNEDATWKVMSRTFQYMLKQHKRLPTTFPIVLGGDCSITPAVFMGFKDAYPGAKVGLLYVDGDADLTLPSQTSAEGSSGVIDSMTMTHLTYREGALPQMSTFRNRDGTPLVDRKNVVLFGFDPLQPITEHWVYLVENKFKVFTRPTVRSDPVVCAKRALEYLSARVDVIYVHFDVDVIDSGEFPLANYPHYAGLDFDQAMASLKIFLAHPKVRGLTITEVNPNNDPSGVMVNRLVDGVVDGMKGQIRARPFD